MRAADMTIRIAEQESLGFPIPSGTIDGSEYGDFPRNAAETKVERGSQFLGAVVWSLAPG